MTFGSLFAGIGGFDLGFERAGMRCVWQVENNEFCNRILETHWPHVARFGDVRKWSPDRDEHSCDVICGGFPCQDLSVAGKRAGLAGEQSGLFWDALRAVSTLRPEFVVLENVPGLLSSNGGRDMGAVVGALEDAGYSVAWRVLDSQWFGVAQRRRRVFIVGHSDPGRAGAVLFEPEGGNGDSPAMRKAGTDIAHCLDGRSGGVSGKENQEGRNHAYRTERTGALQHKGNCASGNEAGTIIARSLNAHHGRIDGDSETFVAMPADEPLQQQRSDDGGCDVSHALRSEGYDASEDGTGRGTPLVVNARQDPIVGHVCLDGDGHSHAVTCATPDADRVRDTPGLPRGLDSARYRALGNAVTVPVAEWIGRRIMRRDAG